MPLPTFMLLAPGFEPYAQVPLPEAPLSPKFHVNVTSCVTLFATDASAVAVASKNTNSGAMPDPRATPALRCNAPLCVAHVPPAVTGGELVAVTVIPKAGSAAEDVPSLTLITTLAS